MTPLRGQNQMSKREKAIRAARARRKRQVNQCYREHVPPQVRELRRSAHRTGTAFVEWTRTVPVVCACGKRFGAVKWLRKHQEKCHVRVAH